MERVLEPELMTDVEQAEAYARADFDESNGGFVRRFLQLFPEVQSGAVADLGCGPADIPIRLAKALPGITITGVDGSEPMMAPGRPAIAAAGLSDRITLVQAHLPGAPLPDRGFKAVISNSLVHHLPDPQVLWAEAKRLGAPGAALLVMDLARPDSPEQAREIIERVSPGEAPVLKVDFFNSLCAAFTLDEVRRQLDRAELAYFDCEMVSDRHWAAWGRL